jgi:hypothetical protein
VSQATRVETLRLPGAALHYHTRHRALGTRQGGHESKDIHTMYSRSGLRFAFWACGADKDPFPLRIPRQRGQRLHRETWKGAPRRARNADAGPPHGRQCSVHASSRVKGRIAWAGCISNVGLSFPTPRPFCGRLNGGSVPVKIYARPQFDSAIGAADMKGVFSVVLDELGGTAGAPGRPQVGACGEKG